MWQETHIAFIKEILEIELFGTSGFGMILQRVVQAENPQDKQQDQQPKGKYKNG